MIINVEKFLAAVERYPFRNVSHSRGRQNSSSPFGDRADNTPSFSLITDPASKAFGCWTDSGSRDPAWARGGPVKIYAFIRNITEQESREELYEEPEEGKRPELRIRLRLDEPQTLRKPVDITTYITNEVPYLTDRGITPSIQRIYRCGFDRAKSAAVMPWAAPNATIYNAKWRATWGKAFWYARGGAPIRSMIYGIDIAYRRNVKRAIIGEAEIDAMSGAVAGTLGLAVGGSEFTEEKAELLRRSPINELFIAGDNDAAGEKLRWEIERKMRGHMRLRALTFPQYAKDSNDVLKRDGPGGLREVIEGAAEVRALRLFAGGK